MTRATKQPVLYARMLELVVMAGLNEAQLLTALPATDLAPGERELPAPLPRQSARRRR